MLLKSSNPAMDVEKNITLFIDNYLVCCIMVKYEPCTTMNWVLCDWQSLHPWKVILNFLRTQR